jgi:heme-degrading monooxygenase HmoA
MDRAQAAMSVAASLVLRATCGDAVAVLRTLLLLSIILSACGTAPAARAPASSGSVRLPCGAAIARVWHGKTKAERGDDFVAYLTPEVAKFREIPGNLGYQFMRETVGDVTHFTVISYWVSRDAIHGYAGADISRTHNGPRDSEFLIDPEDTVKNYDLVIQAFDCPR